MSNTAYHVGTMIAEQLSFPFHHNSSVLNVVTWKIKKKLDRAIRSRARIDWGGSIWKNGVTCISDMTRLMWRTLNQCLMCNTQPHRNSRTMRRRLKATSSLANYWRLHRNGGDNHNREWGSKARRDFIVFIAGQPVATIIDIRDYWRISRA